MMDVMAHLASTPHLLAVAAAVAVAVFLAGLWVGWSYGPGAMQRRKRARQELLLNARARQIRGDGMRPSNKKAARAIAKMDREAFEREVRRWD
jgi:hypothetical protein